MLTAPFTTSRRSAVFPRSRHRKRNGISILRSNSSVPDKLAEARVPLDHFFHMMELTAPYQASLDEVKTIEGPIAGRPVLTFAPMDLVTLRGVQRRATANAVQFTDATADAGLPDAPSP